ncbi:MAG: DUF5060 domain-containing protein [Candidatus Omnitrophica bacterium]|nr:DUF5060 domain-containing protein [Candidatus Omnitrophota bacterium]
MKKVNYYLLCFGVTLLCTVSVTGDACAKPDIESISVNGRDIPRFDMFELTISVIAEFENPYDPEQIDVQTIFTSPSQKPYTAYGFFYQPFTRTKKSGRQKLQKVGEPVWKVRFAPFEEGTWSYRVLVRTAAGQEFSNTGYFKCVASDYPGFVRVGGRQHFDPRPRYQQWFYRIFPRLAKKYRPWYFSFDNGKFFFPIGENLAWSDPLLRTYSYDEWCGKLAEYDCNFIRLWMAPWCMIPEWKHTGLGTYDQQTSWELDYVFDLCREKGLYVVLCFLDHGQFSRTQDAEWHNNPYNADNGGPCKVPAEFLTNNEAKTFFKRKLRYMASRWGYSRNLMSWEWFNEADLSELDVEDLPEWILEMDRYLTTLDPYNHMRTTSFYKDDHPDVWSLDQISFTQLHIYNQRNYAEFFSPEGNNGIPGKYKKKTFERSRAMVEKYNKPFLVGEFGWIDELIRRLDQDGIHLHNALWASILSYQAGTPMVWYWDLYVHPNNLYYHFKAVARFLEGVDFLHSTFEDARVVLTGCPEERVMLRAIESDGVALVWLHNREYNLDQHIACLTEEAKNVIRKKRNQPLQGCSFPPSFLENITLRFPHFKQGTYQVRWYNTFTGEQMQKETVASGADGLTVRVPKVMSDIAGKIERIKGIGWFWQ